MAGLDNIISQILSASEDAAKETLAAARKHAEEILALADRDAAAECLEIQKQSEKETKEILARGKSAADLKCRQGLLACRQQLISQVLAESLDALKNMEEEDYFSFLEQLAVKSALPGEGTLYLSDRDLGRLPKDFEDKVNGALKEKKSVLRVSKTPGDLENGLLLSYGGIEQNASLDALFDASREALQDLVQNILFP